MGMKSPLTTSGNLLISFKQELQNYWVIVYGTDFGVLGYSMCVQLNEPNQSDPFAFPEYNIVYGNVNLLIGKQLPLRKRKLLIGIVGGSTYFYPLFPSTDYTISEVGANGKGLKNLKVKLQ